MKMYPLKFKPVYKDYIWGGRGFEKFGRSLPEGILAESWEISSHPDGMSIVANGELEGMPLAETVKKFGRQLVGDALPQKDIEKFPLLVKFIDANDKLSVQVHPDDSYARVHENGEYGKNEMWYVMDAKPGSKLVYDVVPGTTRDAFAKAVREDRIEECLNFVEVFPGDVLNIPAGLMHALGEGIMIAEIQQNSNTTYRVYDYNRTDKDGNKRPLHIEKALEVIDFNSSGGSIKSIGLEVKLDTGSSKTYVVANRYFSIEMYKIDGSVEEIADGSRFFIYVFTEGEGEIVYGSSSLKVQMGESVLIPASMGQYALKGRLNAMKAYVPDIEANVMTPLKNAGYTEKDILENVSGLK